MVNSIKSLAKDTSVYGVSSIVGRLLNWLLVPVYTYIFAAEEYGIVTEVYAYVAVLLIILTYGMETGFFRFANHERWKDPLQVYTTSLSALLVSSSVFIVIVLVWAEKWAELLSCANNPDFVVMMGITVAVDAFTSLPFAYLRYKRQPFRFALLKVTGIALNIGFNLFFLLLLPAISNWAIFSWMYYPRFGIGYIFLSNLISSAVVLILLIPEISCRWSFSSKLLREMLSYSFPLLVLGIAGVMNQTIDKILYPYLVSDPQEAMSGLGIYGANYKIAVILVMFLQAFRFAYEPFVFAKAKEKKKDNTYSDAMKWFLIVAMYIFLGVMLLLEIVKHFIAPEYYSGLKVVPIIMLAELFFGIFFNLSIWYKISDRTVWGTWFSIIGLAVTLAMNAILVPRFGYMGCAWAAFSCYAIMMILSWLVGRFKNPIDYDMKSLAFYFILGILLWIGTEIILNHGSWPDGLDVAHGTDLLGWIVKILVLGLYPAVVYIKEFRLAGKRLSLPLRRKRQTRA